MKKITLLQMKERKKGKISEVAGGSSFVNRMMSIGIYRGREITKLSHFAMRGPVMVKVGRAVIALGHTMAGKIIVSVE